MYATIRLCIAYIGDELTWKIKPAALPVTELFPRPNTQAYKNASKKRLRISFIKAYTISARSARCSKLTWKQTHQIRIKPHRSKLLSVFSEMFSKLINYGFDTMAALSVLKLREEFPQIKLILVLPHPEQAKSWTDENKKYTAKSWPKRIRLYIRRSAIIAAVCTSATGI